MGLVLLLVLAVLAANAFDDSLTPEARAMLKGPANPVPDAQNVYVMLAGLDAPPGESVLQRGQKNIQRWQRALATPSDSSIPADILQTPDLQRFAVPFSEIGPWPLVHGSVWDKARDEAAHIADLSGRHRELLQRYAALHEPVGYFETLPPDYRAQVFFVPPSVRALYLADLAQRIRNGSSGEQALGLRSLCADLSLWQRILLGQGTMISKLVALSNIHADLLLLSDAMADPGVPVQVVQASMGPWFASMSEDQWKIGKVFAAESRVLVSGMRSIDHPAQYLLATVDDSRLRSLWYALAARLLYLPNATLNALAASAQAIGDLSDGDAATLQRRAQAYAQRRDTSTAYSFPGIVRNLAGKKVANLGWPVFLDTPLRSYDVAALQRAVVLAYQIRLQGIALDDVPRFMKEHPEWAMHPVGPTALQWDSGTAVIRVPQQVGGRHDRRFDVRVFQTASTGLR